MPDDEREFAWLTPTSRWGCVSATAIRMYLQGIKADEALQKSLNRYSKNGDLISDYERSGVLMDACMLKKDAEWDLKRERESEAFERRYQARKAM